MEALAGNRSLRSALQIIQLRMGSGTRIPSLCVSRQRLLVRLDEGRQGKLTLVLAPAGSGRTILVHQWIDAQGQDTQAAWLSLDPEDDDPIRFWHYMLTVYGFFEGEPGHDALKLLSTTQSFFTL